MQSNKQTRKAIWTRLAILLLLCGPSLFAVDEPSTAVAHAESVYADVSDAYGVLELLNSGFMNSYQKKDRATWQKEYDDKRNQVVALLSAIKPDHLSPSDARAVAVMRKTIQDLSESANSMQPGGTCKDAPRRDLDYPALRSALYACFTEIPSEFEGKKLDRAGALSLLGEIEEPARRKALFLAFVPLWQAINGNDQPDSPYRREIVMAAAEAAKYGSAIDDAAKTVGVSSAQVETWLEQILDTWRQVSGDQSIEPWDFRYQGGKADRELASAIPRSAMLPVAQRYYGDLGADLKNLGIIYDLDPRPGKAPLAFSDFVTHGRMLNRAWHPSVAWVSASYANGGLSLMNEFVHENGHAIHAEAVHTRPAFMDLGDAVFYEAFADVTSWDTYEPAWQQKYLGKSASEADSLRDLYSGVILDVAWSLFEIKMLHNPSADPNVVWTDITSRYLHIVPHPELSWWAVRVQLVESPGYMVNYGLGAVITAHIRQHIRESLGPFATGDRRWYGWITENLLHYGEEKESSELLRDFLGRPVSPQALLQQLHRMPRVHE